VEPPTNELERVIRLQSLEEELIWTTVPRTEVSS